MGDFMETNFRIRLLIFFRTVTVNDMPICNKNSEKLNIDFVLIRIILIICRIDLEIDLNPTSGWKNASEIIRSLL